MRSGFWKNLKKPFFVLAPMADVTDAAFRAVIASRGKPDALWTEFVSADGLSSRGKEKLLPDLWFKEEERPIVAQLFTSQPENMKKAAALVAELGFDGLDINMGCPDRSIEKQGAGASLIKTPEIAVEVLRAAAEGAPDLPISVKTRIGYNKENIAEWIPILLRERPAALTVHFRTRKEMSKVPAKWELSSEILALRDQISPETLVIGNGDVKDMEDAREKARRFGVDGVMIGRGIFGNPWFFAGKEPGPRERLEAALEHILLYEKMYAGIKRFEVMKKHIKAYVSHFDGAKELRIDLMLAKNAKEAAEIIKKNI